MKHKYAKLIAIWNEDNSTEFEFAYGTGVDFVWADCDITYVIRNPSAQVRVKDGQPSKEKRWIIHANGALLTRRMFTSEGSARLWIDEFNRADEGVFVNEIEVEV